MDRSLPTAEPDGDHDAPPSAIDRHVGSRIGVARALRGLSRQQLADVVGLTEIQADAAERGVLRMSAERLFQIADVLALPIAWFFEGLDRAIDHDGTAERRGFLQLAYTVSADDRKTHLSALSAMGWVLVGQSLARQSIAAL